MARIPRRVPCPPDAPPPAAPQRPAVYGLPADACGPLYAGHFVVYLGYTLLHLHPATAGLYLLFVAGQSVRARLEERKFRAAFPEYEEYRAATGMFIPAFGRTPPKS